MGFFDKITGKKEEETKEPAPEGKYEQVCSLCNKYVVKWQKLKLNEKYN